MPQIYPTPQPVSPDQIAGLYAWYDASNPASLNVSNGATVSTWNDLSGNGLHFSAINNTANVTYVSNAINGKGCIDIVNGGRLHVDNFWTTAISGRFSMFIVWKITENGTEPAWDGSSGFWFNQATTSPQKYTVQNAGSFQAPQHSRTDGWHSFHWLCDYYNTSYPVGLGHWAIDYGAHKVGNGGLSGGSDHELEIPRSGSLRIAELIFFDHMLGWHEQIQIHEYLSTKYNTFSAIDEADSVIVSLGNSTTAGGWPYYLGMQLQDVKTPTINLGYSGGTASTMNTQQPEIEEVIDVLRAKGKKVVVTLFHGHNNMSGTGGGQGIVEHIKSSQFSDIRATGAKILALTTTPWNNNADKEIGRAIINDFLRSPEALDYVDAVYDLAGTEEFGVYTDSKADFPDYWADDVHFTDLGHQKVAEFVQQAARDLIADTPGLLTPGTITVESSDPGDVRLTAGAPTEGFGPFTYQWKRDGVDLSGKTSLSLIDATAEAGETYAYSLTITDAGGYYLTSDATEVEVATEEPEPGDRYGHPNDAVAKVAATRATGSTSIVVDDASSFAGAVFPLRLSARRFSDGGSPFGDPIAIFRATGLSGTTFVLDGVLEGTTDAPLEEGDYVYVGPTGGDFSDLWDALDSKIDSADLDALQDSVDSLTTTVSGKADQSAVDSLTTTVAGKASQSSVDTLQTQVTDLQTEVDSLSTTVSGKASQSSVDSLTTTVSGKADQSDLDDLQTEVDSLSTTVSGKASQSSVDSLSSTVSTLSTTVSGKADQADLTTLEGTVSTLSGTVSTLSTTVASKASQSSVDSLQTQVDDLQDTVDGLPDLSGVESSISTLEGSVSTLSSSVAAKADDNAVVKLTGAQSISGTKSFSDGLLLKNSVGTTTTSFDANGYGLVDRITFVLARGVDLVTGTNLTRTAGIAAFDGTIKKVLIKAGANGSSGGFTLDVKVNGTSIFATAPTVANSTTTVQSFTPSTTAIGEGDEITVDCTSVGLYVQDVNVTVVMVVGNQ